MIFPQGYTEESFLNYIESQTGDRDPATIEAFIHDYTVTDDVTGETYLVDEAPDMEVINGYRTASYICRDDGTLRIWP